MNSTNRKKIYTQNINKGISNMNNMTIDFMLYTVNKSVEVENYYLIEANSNIKCYQCPHCNNQCNNIHGKKDVYPLMGIINTKPIIMKLTKSRFKCYQCLKTFIEPTMGVDYRCQISSVIKDNTLKYIMAGQTYTDSAKLSNISTSSSIRIFDNHNIKSIRYTKVRNILIDELRLLSTKKHYQFAVIDADTRELLDLLPTRKQKDVYEYLVYNFEVGDLQTITMDLWNPYRNAVKLFNNKTGKNVKIVADKFHFVRQVIWDLDTVRIEEYEKEKLNSKNYKKIKHISKILRIRKEKLSPKAKQRLQEAFDISKRLYVAYQFKEQYLHLVKNCPSKEKFIKEIKQWLEILEEAKLNGYKRTITSHNNWMDEISNSFEFKYSNGYIEGANQKMKLAKNKAFGFSNFKRTAKLMQITIGKRKVI